MTPIYTYTIPNQWHTKVQSLKPGLTHYVHVGDTYIATDFSGARDMVALYASNGRKAEMGLLE